MNKIIKQIIKFADKTKIELMSLTPVLKFMKEMEYFSTTFKKISENDNLELDMVYITFTEDGDNVLIPVFDDKIIEELIIRVNADELKIVLDMYRNLEVNEKIEMKKIIYN